jgi:hypothetical protein
MQSTDDRFEIVMAEVTAELPVFVCSLAGARDALALARCAIDELRVTHPQSPQSNLHASYMSPWKSHLLNQKMVPLAQTVAALTAQVAGTIAQRPLASLNLEMAVTDCWGAIYGQGDGARRHNHFPADFAAVAYLEAEEGCAPIIFAGRRRLQPRPGTLVIFPGVLDHEVPDTPGRRVVVAMNLAKKLTFPTPAADQPMRRNEACRVPAPA